MTISLDQLERLMIKEASGALGSGHPGALSIPPELTDKLMDQFNTDGVKTLHVTLMDNPDFCLYLYKINPAILQKLNDDQLIRLFQKFPAETSLSFEFASDAQKNDVDLVKALHQIQAKVATFASGDVVMQLIETLETKHLSRAQKTEYVARVGLSKPKQIEIGHVLGIIPTGWSTTAPVLSSCSRYQELSGDKHALPFQPIENIESGTLFKSVVESKERGHYQGVQAGWSKHAFTLHAIQDGELTHFVYVNRGEKYESAEGVEGTVHVFSCKQSEAADFAEKLEVVFKTQDKDKVSAFLETKIKTPLYNTALSASLSKSNQKIGNCTVANANISWHFNLASQAMRETPGLSFSDAYKKTSQQYKALRTDDRVRSFCDFMQIQFHYEANVFETLLSEIMTKFYLKDQVNPERHTIENAVQKLSEKDPKLLSALEKGIEKAVKNPPKGMKPEDFQAIAAKWKQAIANTPLVQFRPVHTNMETTTKKAASVAERYDQLRAADSTEKNYNAPNNLDHKLDHKI